MTSPKDARLQPIPLSPLQHDRDVAGFRYVYPVLSRRAGGVSIGINLNPNNACNWRCIYCQVPQLVRGSGPNIDLALLEKELLELLSAIAAGAYFDDAVPQAQRTVRDFALSGNGEPTSSPQFLEVIELLGRVKASAPSLISLPLVVITNGSLIDRTSVSLALARLRDFGGTVWFKLDRASDAGLRATNSTSTSLVRHLARLRTVAQLCPTWVQSCWYTFENQPPSDEEQSDFVAALASLWNEGVPLRGVQLYTVARQSHQPEAALLGPVTEVWLEQLAAPLRNLGISVKVAP